MYRGISPAEVARLRVTYGLVKEHAEAIEQGVDEIDPEKNPLIDPRSVRIDTKMRIDSQFIKKSQSRKEKVI